MDVNFDWPLACDLQSDTFSFVCCCHSSRDYSTVLPPLMEILWPVMKAEALRGRVLCETCVPAYGRRLAEAVAGTQKLVAVVQNRHVKQIVCSIFSAGFPFRSKQIEIARLQENMVFAGFLERFPVRRGRLTLDHF